MLSVLGFGRNVDLFRYPKLSGEWEGDPVKNRTKLGKAELVESIHASVTVPKQRIHKTIELFYEAVKKGLLEGRTVELRGFGTFELKRRKGRTARNPKTGEQVQVETHGVAVFRPGTELRSKAWTLRG